MNLRSKHIATVLDVPTAFVSTAIAAGLPRDEHPAIDGKAREFTLLQALRVGLIIWFRRHGACPAEVQAWVTGQLVADVAERKISHVVMKPNNERGGYCLGFASKKEMLSRVAEDDDVSVLPVARLYQALRTAALMRVRDGEQRSGWAAVEPAGFVAE